MKRYDTPPLTKEERKWIKDLERVLLRAPPRLELYTIGDAGLSVFTNEFGTDGPDNIEDCHTTGDGRGLGTIRSACKIHGLCG